MKPHLLHIDSSIQGDASTSRLLAAKAASRWQEAHPDGTVTYRDLAANPLPHLDFDGAMARVAAPDAQTPAQIAAMEISRTLIDEVLEADTVLLGLPLYNYGPPSTVKSWVDHLVAPGLSIDVATMTGMLGGRQLVVLASRGGGYGPGTPREGWDHAQEWLTHALSITGLEPHFITAELTLAGTNPRMESLKPLAAESLAAAVRAVDGLWSLAAV